MGVLPSCKNASDALKAFLKHRSILCQQQTFGIELAAGDGKYRLAGHNPDRLSRAPELENTQRLSLGTHILRMLFNAPCLLPVTMS
jgi:hypothetical protein